MPEDREYELLTYSALNCFRNCEMRYKLRYLDNLVPLQRSEALSFGTLMHSVLETHHSLAGSDVQLTESIGVIDEEFPAESMPDDPTDDRFRMAAMARAMYGAYYRLYTDPVTGRDTRFDVLEDDDGPFLERVFELPIVNPETGATSRTYRLAGKIDGVAHLHNGDVCLLEHKTARSIDESYLESAWRSTQNALYVLALREMGYPVSGVVYNVLRKCYIKASEGWTEEEYQRRYAEACAKNKSGKSSLKRKLPETAEAFLARMMEWYDRDDAFHWENIYLTQRRLDLVMVEIWETTKRLLYAKQRNLWVPNWSYCDGYGHCPYLPYCLSDWSSIVRDNQYAVEEPHSELREEEPIEEPVF